MQLCRPGHFALVFERSSLSFSESKRHHDLEGWFELASELVLVVTLCSDAL